MIKSLADRPSHRTDDSDNSVLLPYMIALTKKGEFEIMKKVRLFLFFDRGNSLTLDNSAARWHLQA